jgi:hypothetical protein
MFDILSFLDYFGVKENSDSYKQVMSMYELCTNIDQNKMWNITEIDSKAEVNLLMTYLMVFKKETKISVYGRNTAHAYKHRESVVSIMNASGVKAEWLKQMNKHSIEFNSGNTIRFKAANLSNLCGISGDIAFIMEKDLDKEFMRDLNHRFRQIFIVK